MNKTCLICGQSRPEESCHVVQLSAEEEASLAKDGVEAREEYVYCNPCWRILKDPEAGPSLMRGVVERQFLSAGVPPHQAKKMADRYHTRLLELNRQAKHGTQA